MAKKIKIENIELGDTGSLSRDKINKNFNRLNLSIDNKADKSDVAIGMINKGTVNKVLDLPVDVKRGDAYCVESEGFVYQYDGEKWNKTVFTAFPRDVAVHNDVSAALLPFSNRNNDVNKLRLVKQCLPNIHIIGNKEAGYEYILRVLRNNNIDSQIQIDKVNKVTGASTIICNDWVGYKRSGVETLYGCEFKDSGYAMFAVIDWNLVYEFSFEGNIDLTFDDSAFSENLAYIAFKATQNMTFNPYKNIIDVKTLNNIKSAILCIQLIGTPESGCEYVLRVAFNRASSSQIQIDKLNVANGASTIICNNWVGYKRSGIETLHGCEFKDSGYAMLVTVDWDKLASLTLSGGYKFNTDQIFNNNISSVNSKAILDIKPYQGKKALHIGDSLTVMGYEWQQELQKQLGLSSYKVHALGGINLPMMVDGHTSSQGTLAPLSVNDVKDKDIITIWGGYNSRTTPYGEKGDLYPAKITIRGHVNYVINRVYQLLKQANNLQCKVLFITPHCVGKYDWVDADGYTHWGGVGTLQDMSKAIEDECNNIGVPCLNMFNNSGINRFNWNQYQRVSRPDNPEFRFVGEYNTVGDLPTGNEKDVAKIKAVNTWDNTYIHNGTEWVRYYQYPPYSPYPYNADQLHLGTNGNILIAGVFAGALSKM